MTQQSTEKDTTHFGYKKVPLDEKADRVADVFHSVAGKYDIMNDLLSMGIHRVWKRFTIEVSGVRAGHQVLDVAGGTGDLTRYFSRLVGPTGKVILSDINSSMLDMGRDRLIDQGYTGNVEYVQANAECLPFADNSFDCITIAFGLRNVTDKDAALRSLTRVLKPGGRLLVLEFSKPGKLVANDSESYKYLAESIRMHPDQDTLKQMMEEAGLTQCQYHNMSGGIVALHRGVKP